MQRLIISLKFVNSKNVIISGFSLCGGQSITNY